MCSTLSSPICRSLASRDPRYITHLAQVFLCCLFLFPAGCKISPRVNQPVAQVHPERDVSASFEQTRLRMRAMVHPMSSVIVEAADQILAGTTDRAIRREALLWKIQAVPALREALFLPTPLGALADTWVLTFQMIDYFEKGPGAKALGETRGIAVTASQRLEAEIARIAASMTISGDVSGVREYARKWAADHAITRSVAGRESFLSEVAQREWASSFSITQAVGNVMVSVDDLNRRVEIYSAQLPDQARWQAELFAMDMADEYQLDKTARTAGQAVEGLGRVVPAMERSVSALEKAMPMAESAAKSVGHAVDVLDRTTPAVERSLAVVEQTPALVTAEREATMKTLSAELSRTIVFIDQERVVALKQITAERTAAVRDIDDTLIQERKLLTQEIDATALKAVDHAFFRAAQLCAGLLVAVFLGLVLLILLARRVSSGPRRA